MKKLILTTLMLPCLQVSYAQELSAKEIIRKADEKKPRPVKPGNYDNDRGETRLGKDNHYEDLVEKQGLFSSTDYRSGQRQGTGFLKIKTEMWNWVPSIDKTIKIPPSMMLQSWMGSDFTNDDLVKQSSIVVDYTHKLLGREKVREMECYKIELTPLPDAAVIWGKVIMWITVNGYDQWMAEYYDEDNKLVNVSNNYDIKRMGDREIPTRLEMIPQNKKGQKTIIHIDDMRFNAGIDESFFSQQNMKKIR